MKIVSFGDGHMAIGQMSKIALELATGYIVVRYDGDTLDAELKFA